MRGGDVEPYSSQHIVCLSARFAFSVDVRGVRTCRLHGRLRRQVSFTLSPAAFPPSTCIHRAVLKACLLSTPSPHLCSPPPSRREAKIHSTLPPPPNTIAKPPTAVHLPLRSHACRQHNKPNPPIKPPCVKSPPPPPTYQNSLPRQGGR